MAKRRATLIRGPWSKSRALSPLAVYTASQNYWSNITATRKSLLSARRVILSHTTIRPSQCDCIIISLREAILLIQAFYKFLDKQEHGICSSRYPVLYTLIDSEALLEDLIEPITTFRERCWVSSSQNVTAILNIQYKFDALFQNWKTMKKHVTDFLDSMSMFLDDRNKPAEQSRSNIRQLHDRPHQVDELTHSFTSSPHFKAPLQI